MKPIETLDQQLAAFPAALRALVEAELAAGNTVVEVAGGFPAPPVGAFVRLAKPITTRLRESMPPLRFYERKSALYSGEWTDAKRYYFVLEPAQPPPEPDMDAIRAVAMPLVTPPVGPSPGARSNVERFADSMRIDYEKWYDGIGYDLEILKQASATEQNQIETLLLSRVVDDWRDVEALAALPSERAREALSQAFAHGTLTIRNAVTYYAPALVSDAEKTAHLITALRIARIYDGLSQALNLVVSFHPPEIVRELQRGALEREGDVAGHLAAMLLFIHGQAETPFDWSQRPFLLRFNTEDRAERETVYRELCDKIGAG